MPISVTFLEQGGQRPDSIAALLADFIAAARTSLHVAIYDFRLSALLAKPVVDAIRSVADAGVDVRIAYDAGKKQTPFSAAGCDPAEPGTGDFVRSLGPAVKARAITGGDPRIPRLMHQKYVIRDGRQPGGSVWTGSTNFTDDSWTLEENNILRIDSATLCAYYETDFEELWARGDIATTGAHDTGTVQVDGAPVRVAFAPGEGQRIDHDVAHSIAGARRRIRVASMLVTSGTILGALGDCLQHDRVADYGGLYDGTQMQSVFNQWRGSPAEWKIGAFKQIAARLVGKVSTPYRPGSPHDYMHNKVLVVDDTVVTGSYNLSHSATENAENILQIRDPALAEQYVAYIDRLSSRYRKAGATVPS